jgi:phage baseplate assembly protein W
MQINVNTESPINWHAKGDDRIAQNVANLLRFFQFEVPFDRARGLSTEVIDLSSEKQSPLIISETYRVIETYEPRCQLMSVEQSEDGQIEVVIEI